MMDWHSLSCLLLRLLLLITARFHSINATNRSICSPFVFVQSIDPTTQNQYVSPCPVSEPCRCLCNSATKRLWIDCFHRQLTVLPTLKSIPSNRTRIEWNIDLAFNRFENLSVRQWIPKNLQIRSLIFSNDLADDLIVELNLNHRHLIEKWEDSSHLIPTDATDEKEHLSSTKTLRRLTDLTLDLREKSRSIRSFNLSLAGDYPHPSISILYLDHNLLESIPIDALYNATTLEELYLSSNRLTDLPAFAFGFSHRLTRLDLSHNQISSIDQRTFDRHPNAFAGPFLIDYLDLSSNQLVFLPAGVFSYLVNLRLLKLQHNRIRSLSAHVWTGLYRLKYLDLSHNQLENFTQLFYSSYLNELSHLKLSSNNITHFNSCEFLSLKSLTKLDLNNNKLSELAMCSFYGLEPSTRLYLRSNAFESIHPCPLSFFTRSTIHIDQNPLLCNCSFNYLLQERQSFVYTGQECQRGYDYPIHSQFYQTAVRKNQRKSKKKLVNSSNLCRPAFKVFQNLCSKLDCFQTCAPNEQWIIQISTIATPSAMTTNFQRTSPFILSFTLVYVIFHRILQEIE